MKIDNNDPIQELKPFRWGIDNLTEDDGLNPNYSDDLHNCSNDLSEEGSIVEEIEHAEFAKRKKQERLNNYSNYKYQTKNNYYNIKKYNTPIVYYFIFIILVSFVVPILSLIGTTMREESKSLYFEEETYKDYDRSSNINEVTVPLNGESEYYIDIDYVKAKDGTIVVCVNNENNRIFNYVDVETIFYDENYNIITSQKNYIDTLFVNKSHLFSIYDVPENYATIEFIVTQEYDYEKININIEDIQSTFCINDQDMDVIIGNNTEELIDRLEFVVIYYKEGHIIGISTHNVYNIYPFNSCTEKIYHYYSYDEYDQIKVHINDIYNSN